MTSSTWAGDGNFRVIIVFDPQDAEELGRVKEANDEIVNQAIDAGGTCAGEHGIGYGAAASSTSTRPPRA